MLKNEHAYILKTELFTWFLFFRTFESKSGQSIAFPWNIF